MDSLIGMFLAGGFSADLTHHVMHAIGGRMWGFTQEVFEESAAPSGRPAVPTPQRRELEQLTQHYPNIATMAASLSTMTGPWSGAAATTSSSSSSPST